jgi:hypothetical protein
MSASVDALADVPTIENVEATTETNDFIFNAIAEDIAGGVEISSQMIDGYYATYVNQFGGDLSREDFEARIAELQNPDEGESEPVTPEASEEEAPEAQTVTPSQINPMTQTLIAAQAKIDADDARSMLDKYWEAHNKTFGDKMTREQFDELAEKIITDPESIKQNENDQESEEINMEELDQTKNNLRAWNNLTAQLGGINDEVENRGRVLEGAFQEITNDPTNPENIAIYAALRNKYDRLSQLISEREASGAVDITMVREIEYEIRTIEAEITQARENNVG